MSPLDQLNNVIRLENWPSNKHARKRTIQMHDREKVNGSSRPKIDGQKFMKVGGQRRTRVDGLKCMKLNKRKFMRANSPKCRKNGLKWLKTDEKIKHGRGRYKAH